jgi:hypothetical protein
MRRLGILAAILISTTAAAADDSRVIKLEQDVRNLERQVGELSRQLAAVQQDTHSVGQRLTSLPATPAATSSSWLDAARWKQVRKGMTELEVITLLGPPTSMRGAADSGNRTLLYAMEIGSAGFLSGSVELSQQHVVAVQIPTLR